MAERGLGPLVALHAPDHKLAAIDAMVALRAAHLIFRSTSAPPPVVTPQG